MICMHDVQSRKAELVCTPDKWPIGVRLRLACKGSDTNGLAGSPRVCIVQIKP
jgi:hypothetical protein